MTSRAAAAVGAQEQTSTRERILEVALDLFSEQGYESTSLRQIAEVMGFTKAALYYHFASKDDILMALHLRLHEFGNRSLRQLGEVSPSPAVWSKLLVELVDDMLDQRKLLLFHQRDMAAIAAVQAKHPDHDDGHADMPEVFRSLLSDSSVDVRDRVRLGAAIGAMLSTMALVGSALGDVARDDLAKELRSVVRDILRPARAHTRTR